MKEVMIDWEGLNKQRGSVRIQRSECSSAEAIPFEDVSGESEVSKTINGWIVRLID